MMLTKDLRRTVSRLANLPVVVCLPFLALACSEPKPAGDPHLQPAYDKSTGRLEKLSYDSNGDGVIDTWGYMDGTRVIRVEADENQDGKIDRWEYHRQAAASVDSPAGPLETIERVERATRHDGTVSRWEFFEKGALKRVEEDTSGDGQVDKWEIYANGTLASMGLDTLGRGKPERTLYYNPNGSLDRIDVQNEPQAPAPSPHSQN